MNSIRVVFTYVAAAGKWDVVVQGAANPVEAAQAFNSVILTCHTIQSEALQFTAVADLGDGMYSVVPAQIESKPPLPVRRVRPEDN